MLNVLFIWSKCNEDVSYRQGMNELLSPIVLTGMALSVKQLSFKIGIPQYLVPLMLMLPPPTTTRTNTTTLMFV